MTPHSSGPPSAWRDTPRRFFVIFLAAVFLTFASIGFVGDITGMGRQSPPRLAFGVLLSGLFAIGYAYSGIRLRRRFWIAAVPLCAFQIVLMNLLAHAYPDAPRPLQMRSDAIADLESRLNFDGIATTVAISLSYAGFVIVFVSESRRRIRVQTEKALLKGELEAARQVQQVMLPEAGETFPGFRMDSAYAPAQEVGGDFFQLLSDGRGGVLLVLGDVAGKGLPAAMLVSMLVGAIRTAAEDTLEPAQILGRLHNRLIGRAYGGFSTALAAHITREGLVHIANAGHLSPYLDGAELALAGALPLGIAGGGQYQGIRFTLSPGSRLTFYTDGVVEARNRHGELFGFDRTRAISTDTAAAIVRAAVDFGQSDDITVVTIERLAA